MQNPIIGQVKVMAQGAPVNIISDIIERRGTFPLSRPE